MSRMNNTARSLKIISRQNGWDPDVIEGFDVRVTDFHNSREQPGDSDTWPIGPRLRDSSEPCPSPTVSSRPTFYTPDLRENEDHRAPNADPYPEMPGSEESR